MKTYFHNDTVKAGLTFYGLTTSGSVFLRLEKDDKSVSAVFRLDDQEVDTLTEFLLALKEQYDGWRPRK